MRSKQIVKTSNAAGSLQDFTLPQSSLSVFLAKDAVNQKLKNNVAEVRNYFEDADNLIGKFQRIFNDLPGEHPEANALIALFNDIFTFDNKNPEEDKQAWLELMMGTLFYELFDDEGKLLPEIAQQLGEDFLTELEKKLSKVEICRNVMIAYLQHINSYLSRPNSPLLQQNTDVNSIDTPFVLFYKKLKILTNHIQVTPAVIQAYQEAIHKRAAANNDDSEDNLLQINSSLKASLDALHLKFNLRTELWERQRKALPSPPITVEAPSQRPLSIRRHLRKRHAALDDASLSKKELTKEQETILKRIARQKRRIAFLRRNILKGKYEVLREAPHQSCKDHQEMIIENSQLFRALTDVSENSRGASSSEDLEKQAGALVQKSTSLASVKTVWWKYTLAAFGVALGTLACATGVGSLVGVPLLAFSLSVSFAYGMAIGGGVSLLLSAVYTGMKVKLDTQAEQEHAITLQNIPAVSGVKHAQPGSPQSSFQSGKSPPMVLPSVTHVGMHSGSSNMNIAPFNTSPSSSSSNQKKP